MVKKLSESACFIAGDNTWLRELFHPANDKIGTPFSLAYAYLEAGESSLLHKLKTSTETYFFLDGQGTMSIDGEIIPIEKNTTIHVPADAIQSVQNTGTDRLSFLCIVSPPWAAADEIVFT